MAENLLEPGTEFGEGGLAVLLLVPLFLLPVLLTKVIVVCFCAVVVFPEKEFQTKKNTEGIFFNKGTSFSFLVDFTELSFVVRKQSISKFFLLENS